MEQIENLALENLALDNGWTRTIMTTTESPNYEVENPETATKFLDKKFNAPLRDAIKAYMKQLPFNGELILAHLVDHLQRVEGVIIPHIISAQSSWIDPTANGYQTAQPINVRAIPVSGYFEMVDFNGIEYVV